MGITGEISNESNQTSDVIVCLLMNANFTMTLEPNRIIPASVEDQIGLLPFWVGVLLDKWKREE